MRFIGIPVELSRFNKGRMINNTQDIGSTVALLASLNASSGFAMNASVAAGTQARFLKLLVTQMRNQESLDPMDNAQAASQMAQLCTVTGTDKLKALNDSMLSKPPHRSNLISPTA